MLRDSPVDHLCDLLQSWPVRLTFRGIGNPASDKSSAHP